MSGKSVDIETVDGTADAYLVTPDDDGEHPGVLFLIDAFGLRPVIEQMCDRISERGYAVLAPNVLYRGGRAPVLPFPDLTQDDARTKFFDDVRPLMVELTPERVEADGAAYLNCLATVSDPPFAITGYCFGARLGLRIANAEPDRVAAFAGFHGARFITEGDDSPHLAVDDIQAEVYLGHADNDHANPAEDIKTLGAALEEAGVNHINQTYEGAGHGFTMADTPVYDQAATERHFAALFDLLERRL